ncbi:ATP-binding cassette domain-containing protein [Pectobacterium sp. A5351]|uniref:ATP-binding cassette domain-containing protein n=1 Tax=Pectobacterium sp. A5351 TaxID=2914983 RepID=UPI00233022B1|nr:ATP-binding cassette domain-containing protein [Pectobacterium sp. A5351]WCG83580.1 ATP-binding cassette domain-containing protein [Pectobacterium sp. A5351]
MTTLLSVQSVSYGNSKGLLLDEMTFSVNKYDRIGLIGYNGSGKSTVLKILSSALDGFNGNVIISRKCILARVEQELPAALASRSLLEGIIDVLPENEKASSTWRCESLLKEMGFQQEFFEETVENLSGGQHTRLLLARALILNPDLLLLDEPSNHLDLPTMLWLENFLKNWNGTFILVSHDSYLLDKVTESTLILRDKRIKYFHLPCTEARKRLLESDKADLERNHSESKEIERIEKSARRLADWGRIYDNEGLARKALEMNRRVEKLKDDQTVLTEGSKWRLTLKGEAIDADRLLEIRESEIRADKDSDLLFKLDHKKVRTGDRIAIIGSNGVGKSTLLKYIWEKYRNNNSSNLVFHQKVTIGYYDQILNQLRNENTIINSVTDFSKASDIECKMALIGAGFPYIRHNQLVQSLSGGERARLLFIGLSLSKFSLLILDEPTNHLDLEGKEELEAALSNFEGALLLVTHDRKLIKNSCNRYWSIHNKSLHEWNEVNQAYEHVTREINNPKSLDKVSDNDKTSYNNLNEDELLKNLFELESKLDSDMKRKSKHQKIQLQLSWKKEINEIKNLLNLN